jgi:hypothetical protein
VRRVAVLLAVVLAAVGLGALAESGCATVQATGERGERPADAAPDGGWASYRPARGTYDVDPVRAAVGEPSLSPAAPVGTDIH